MAINRSDDEKADRGAAGAKRDADHNVDLELRSTTELITIDTVQVFDYARGLVKTADGIQERLDQLDRWPYFSVYSSPNAYLIGHAKDQLAAAEARLRDNAKRTIDLAQEYQRIDASMPGVGLSRYAIDALFASETPKLAPKGVRPAPRGPSRLAAAEDRVGLTLNAIDSYESLYEATETTNRMRQLHATKLLNDVIAGPAEGSWRRAQQLFGGRSSISKKQWAALRDRHALLQATWGRGFSNTDEVAAALTMPYAGNEHAMRRWGPLARSSRLLTAGDADLLLRPANQLAKLFKAVGGNPEMIARLGQAMAETPGMGRLVSSGSRVRAAARFLGPAGAIIDARTLLSDAGTRDKVAAGMGVTAVVVGSGAAEVLFVAALGTGASGIGAPVAAVLVVTALGITVWDTYDDWRDAREIAAYNGAYAKQAKKVWKRDFQQYLEQAELDSVNAHAAASLPTPTGVRWPLGFDVFASRAEVAA